MNYEDDVVHVGPGGASHYQAAGSLQETVAIATRERVADRSAAQARSCDGRLLDQAARCVGGAVSAVSTGGQKGHSGFAY